MNEKKKQKYPKTIKDYFNKAIYKIAYPFWPKEMRDLIKKYEAEGTLNENWFEAHRFLLTIYVALSFVFLLMLIDKRDLQSLIFFPITPCAILYLHCKHLFKTIISPYSCGRKEEFILKEVASFYGYITNTVFINNITKEPYSTCLIGCLIKEQSFPDTGKKLPVFISIDKKNVVMPDTEEFARKYSLTTESFKKKEKHHV